MVLIDHRIAGTAMAAIEIPLLLSFPGWRTEIDSRTHEEIDVKPFPSRRVTRVILASSMFSTIFFLFSALWQQTAAVTAASLIESFLSPGVTIRTGGVAAFLVWAALSFQTLVFIAVLVLVVSIASLERIVDD